MSTGQWLNSLTALDHFVILGFFIIACFFSWFTLNALRQLYDNMNSRNPYAHEFRITPFSFLGLAFFYTVIMYALLGDFITTISTSLFVG